MRSWYELEVLLLSGFKKMQLTSTADAAVLKQHLCMHDCSFEVPSASVEHIYLARVNMCSVVVLGGLCSWCRECY